jgi:hypothetical protein
MTMPNFLIIGAQKAGTTALYHYLRQHPQIYMSAVKEPHFFAYEGAKPYFCGPRDQDIVNQQFVADIDDYRALFRGLSNEAAIGEASAMYIYLPGVPQRIRHYVPDAKLIAILRNPVERAYSSFVHLRRDDREPISDFAQALREEKARIHNNWVPIWHYKQAGFYYRQLKRYYATFEQHQIKVLLHEELNENPAGALRDIFRFLGVDETFDLDVSARYNVSGIPKNKFLHSLHSFLIRPHPVKSVLKPFLPEEFRRRLLRRSVEGIRNRTLVKPPPISSEVRAALIAEYRQDILQLQDLIGRDLAGWLK